MKENYSEREEFDVKQITESDIKGVLEVQKDLLISNKNREDAEKGFLVREYSQEEFKKFLSDPNTYFLVAKSKENEVIGYILTSEFDKEKWGAKDNLQIYEPEIFKKRIIYGISIGVKEKEKGKGIGTKLNNQLFKLAKEKGFEVFLGDICEGIGHPEIKNDFSIRFHTNNFHMRKVGEYNEGEVLWGIYARDL